MRPQAATISKTDRRPRAGALELAIATRAGRGWEGHLRKHLVAAHALLKPALAELSLAIVGDATMAKLHEGHLGIAGPTDVLTFELDHDGRGRVTAGEVVICAAEARRQARRRGVAERDEAMLYALHGMLHLCGYNDLTDGDHRRMHKKEDWILDRLGIGAVYGAAESKRGGRI